MDAKDMKMLGTRMPTEDLIDRQAAIDAIYLELDMIDHVPQWVFDRLENGIKQLPSAQPMRKKGKWVEKEVTHIDDLKAKDIITGWQSARCIECGKYHTTPYMYYFSDYDFCPNCGADMRE